MKTTLFAVSLAVLPAFASAQEVSVEETDLPPGLSALELARSKACVPAMADIEALNRELAPLSARAVRLQELDQAIALEDSSGVAPFDGTDEVEQAVRAWFVRDAELAASWAQSSDSTLLGTRRQARAEVRTRLRSELEVLTDRGQTRVQEAEDVRKAAAHCTGAIFVRGAVVEACAGVDSQLCRAAGVREPGAFRFVDAAEDIWNVEELRPWTDPGPLRFTPDGALGGSRTAAQARRGNIQVGVALSPMIRERSGVSAEQAAEFDANLDSLGFTFDHPRFVMAPALEIQLGVGEPIGGETHYMVHFGDLTDPANQVVWNVPAAGTGPIQAAFPAGVGALALLQQGQTLHLTAVALSEDTGDGVQADVIYSVPVTSVNQGRAVAAVLSYMASGQLAKDLARLVPPTADGG